MANVPCGHRLTAQIVPARAGLGSQTYQLRHAAGARARRVGGLDAAQALLGHRTVGMTEHCSKLTVEDVVKVATLVGHPCEASLDIPRVQLALPLQVPRQVGPEYPREHDHPVLAALTVHARGLELSGRRRADLTPSPSAPGGQTRSPATVGRRWRPGPRSVRNRVGREVLVVGRNYNTGRSGAVAGRVRAGSEQRRTPLGPANEMGCRDEGLRAGYRGPRRPERRFPPGALHGEALPTRRHGDRSPGGRSGRRSTPSTSSFASRRAPGRRSSTASGQRSGPGSRSSSRPGRITTSSTPAVAR